jgi:formyl-CoA transferase
MSLGRELDGFLVVSMEQALAAPYCGLLLADAGARVIKVERHDGDFARDYDKGANGESGIFAWLNRGKESLCLDINRSDDVALLNTLLSKADIFLHNLAPGALEKRGFGGEALRERNPGLITCEITGYGRSGPAAQKKAYDFLVQAESGLCAVTGSAEAPSRIGISI